MRLLLDTQVLLWAMAEPVNLPKSARARIEDPANDVLFSAASVWELAIKLQIGKLILPISLERIIAAAVSIGFSELPVSAAHAAAVRHLPSHHRDPFDRLPVAQAIAEPAGLLTVDRILARYSKMVELLESPLDQSFGAGGDQRQHAGVLQQTR